MQTVIYRYILKELLMTFMLTLAFLNSVLMMEKLLRLSRLLSGVGASLADMAKIIVYLQPQLLVLTIPMSLLLSTLLVYGRMDMNNEIVILRASGMSFRKISVPVMVLGLLCFFLTGAVSFYVGPKSSIRLRDEITRVIAVRSAGAIEEGTFNTSFKDIVIMVKNRKNPDILENIFIYDSRIREQPRVLIAREGRIFMLDDFRIALLLRNGYINITKGGSTTELFFDSYRLTLNLEAGPPSPRNVEFTPFELLRMSSDDIPDKKKAALLLEFNRRLSLPSVCLMLIFLGPPLSLLAGRSGRLGGLALGLIVFTGYYMLLIYGENLVSAQKIPHYIGGWAPLVVLGICSVYLFRKGDTP